MRTKKKKGARLQSISSRGTQSVAVELFWHLELFCHLSKKGLFVFVFLFIPCKIHVYPFVCHSCCQRESENGGLQEKITRFHFCYCFEPNVGDVISSLQTRADCTWNLGQGDIIGLYG